MFTSLYFFAGGSNLTPSFFSAALADSASALSGYAATTVLNASIASFCFLLVSRPFALPSCTARSFEGEGTCPDGGETTQFQGGAPGVTSTCGR